MLELQSALSQPIDKNEQVTLEEYSAPNLIETRVRLL